MFDYYYLLYDEGIESLANRIDATMLKYDINANIDAENDIFLVHLIFRINTNKGIYRKDKIRLHIWELLSHRCPVDVECPFANKIEHYQHGFNNLFDYCWNQKFSINKDSRDAKLLKKVVYSKMPFKRKLFDSNLSMIICLILFLFCVYYIDKWTINDYSWKYGGEMIDTHPIFATCLALFVGFGLLSLGCKNPIRLTFGPIIACLIFFASVIGMVLFDSYDTIVDNEWQIYEWSDSNLAALQFQIMKRNAYLGLLCLLLIPIFRFNIQRLDDLS